MSDSHPPLRYGSLALLTDLYQLTMAYGYWKEGLSERQAAFCLFYRHNPFGGAFTVGCGLASVVEYVQAFRFTEDDLEYLGSLRGADGQVLFEPAFFHYLRRLEFACDVDIVPEGTVVFPHEPLVRVRGPLWQCQLLETPLLNLMNFQTLVATKAARICLAARGEPVIEFGLRRAQGIDGGLTASRAAYVGGCVATSNVLAGKQYGIPVRGTHAHSWVMVFENELESFQAYADAMPNNCIFLVDTYDTLDGVRHAVQVGQKLRALGHKMLGVRLDSGDLALLSIEARKILDDAGFSDAVIVGSNDLDEYLIADLKQQGCKVNVWGVGTKLATAFDQPALGGVYKLTAIRSPEGDWLPRLKLSEQPIKTSNPGMLQVRRYQDASGFLGDMIYDELQGASGVGVDLLDPGRGLRFPVAQQQTDILQGVFRGGRLAYDVPPLAASRERTMEQLNNLKPATKRFANPTPYPVGLDQRLYELKQRLVREHREAIGGGVR
jgi:nicotinate phosphoribosyltransferase